MTTNSPIFDETLDLPELPAGAPTLARLLNAALGWLGTYADDRGGAEGNLITFAREARSAIRAATPEMPPGEVVLDGRSYMEAPDGSLTPTHLVKVPAQLEDEMVRRIARGALSVAGTLARFKALSFAEALALLDLLAAEHGVTRAGRAGNVTLFSYDRRYRVQIASAERVTFGAGVDVARALLHQWLAEAGASDELRTVVAQAFRLDDQGRLRAQEVARLRRYNITSPLWRQAMDVLADAMVPAGSAEYLRVYERDDGGHYRQIALDLASAGRPATTSTAREAA